jgi:hypothetical protein
MGRVQNVNPPRLGEKPTRMQPVRLGRPGWAFRTALAVAGCQPSDMVKITRFVSDPAAHRSALLRIARPTGKCSAPTNPTRY